MRPRKVHVAFGLTDTHTNNNNAQHKCIEAESLFRLKDDRERDETSFLVYTFILDRMKIKCISQIFFLFFAVLAD